MNINQMTIGHAFLITILIWMVIWALFGWSGVFIAAVVFLCALGTLVIMG